MTKVLIVAAVCCTMISSCIPMAIGYAMYENSKSQDRASRGKVLQKCLEMGKDANDSEICRQFLDHERKPD